MFADEPNQKLNVQDKLTFSQIYIYFVILGVLTQIRGSFMMMVMLLKKKGRRSIMSEFVHFKKNSVALLRSLWLQMMSLDRGVAGLVSGIF